MISKKEMYHLEGLCYLYAISKSNSKREVADHFGTTVDTINKYIKDLNETLNIECLVSTGRGTVISPQGQAVLKYSQQVVQALSSLSEMAKNEQEMLKTIRLVAPDNIAYDLGRNIFIEFMKKHPDMSIISEFRNEIVNLQKIQAEVCLTLMPLQDDNWLQVAEKNIPCSLYASSFYIKNYGMPQNYTDFVKHHRICNKDSIEYYIPKWGEVLRASPLIVLQNNLIATYHTAVKSGIGIGLCSKYYGDKNLIQITTVPELDTSYKIYLSIRKDLQETPKIKAFLEFFGRLF